MKQEKDLDTSKVYVVRDQQGKLYLATKEDFGFLSLGNQPLMYGYQILGTIDQVMNKLAQYRHATRVLRTQVQNQFNQALALFQEIEK